MKRTGPSYRESRPEGSAALDRGEENQAQGAGSVYFRAGCGEVRRVQGGGERTHSTWQDSMSARQKRGNEQPPRLRAPQEVGQGKVLPVV